MAIRMRGDETETKKKLKKLKSSVKVANLDKLKRQKSRFMEDFSDDAMSAISSSSSPPNYMKATTSSSSRKASSQSTSARKKLSSMKSMKIRAKYSQFQENSQTVMLHHAYDQESMVEDGDGDGDDQKSMILKRSRSIKLTKLKSKRYSSTRLIKSRFSKQDENMSYDQVPHYMKGTTSHQAMKKNSAREMTRTSSRRPLRVLAKIPSLRPRKNRVVRKQPDVTPRSHSRSTCSYTLKRSEFPDFVQLLPDGASFVHICPYTYCSLNGHHNHHAPSPPLKEFITAKRKMINNQKGKRLREDIKPSSRLSKIDALQIVNEKKDTGLDFLVTVYDNHRKKWDIEGDSRNDTEMLTELSYNRTSETDYKGELKETEEALNDGLQEPNGTLRIQSVEANNENDRKISTSTTTSNESSESFVNDEDLESNGGDLINILSDKQKYTNMWHLICQQFVPSDSPTTGITEGINDANKESNQLDEEHKKKLKSDEDNQEVPNFDQTAAFMMVREGLSAILERDAQSVDSFSYQQSEPAHDMTNGLASEFTTIHEKSERQEMPKTKLSKSLIRLRRIFVTAKIITAMERMKRISTREPRYLPAKPKSEEERVYLRHLSRNERNNTEEWMLDYAFRSVVSKLGPHQQRRVAQLVEAFEAVMPEQREDNTHYPTKANARDLAIPIKKETEQTIPISHEQVNTQQDDEVSHIGTEETTKDEDIGSCFTREDSELTSEGNMATILLDKQKYTTMWQLIHQQVISSEALKAKNQKSAEAEEEEEKVQTTKETKSNVLNQSVAIKMVKEAIHAILQNHEQILSQQAFQNDDTAHNDEEKPYQKKIPDSRRRLKRLFVTAKFIGAMKRLTKTSWEKPRHLPLETASMDEKVYLRHLSMDGRKNQEEWMLDYALRNVISSLAVEQQRKVASIVGAYETVNLKRKGNGCPQVIKSEPIKDVTEKVNSEDTIGKCLFSNKQKTNSMWHLICQHLQSSNASENGIQLRKDDLSTEMVTEADYDDNDSDTSSVSSEITENDAVKLVKETIDHLLEPPQVVENKLLTSRSISFLEKDQTAGQKLEKSLPRGYTKLRHLIICNKFIKTMQQTRKVHPKKPALYYGEVAGKTRLKSRGTCQNNGTDEWMLDNALQKVISGLAPAKQRRVALLVEAFEKVNPDQEKRGTGLIYNKNEPPSEAIFSERNVKLDIDEVLQDTPSLSKEVAQSKEETLTASPSDAMSTSSDLHRDPIEACGVDSDSINLHKHNEVDPKGYPLQDTSIVRNDVDVDISIPPRHAFLSGSLLSDKQQTNSMWHLICQRLQSSSAVETESNLSEELSNDDDVKRDSDASSVTSELTENDAIKLVKETIDDILERPQVLDQTTGENPENNISRGYSKLRHLIICNKFIKTMQKMRKVHPQKQKLTASDSGESDEWMLDNVLQKVISGLAPAKQRRVAMLVEAFEKVNPGQQNSFT